MNARVQGVLIMAATALVTGGLIVWAVLWAVG
jgi:hypothetical protein